MVFFYAIQVAIEYATIQIVQIRIHVPSKVALYDPMGGADRTGLGSLVVGVVEQVVESD